VLFNEPKLLKFRRLRCATRRCDRVSVLFNEPKLLKYEDVLTVLSDLHRGFSALQRAEIAEILPADYQLRAGACFSALQRAEIAEICSNRERSASVGRCFSALQRAEIAEICTSPTVASSISVFQCSSTSRNC